MATFGSRLRQLREDKGLTQEQLGKVLNVKKAAVSKYENETTSPDHATLCKLADFFDVTTDYLLGQTDIPMKSKDIVDKLVSDKELTDEELRRIQPAYEATKIRNLLARKKRLTPLLGTIRAGLPIIADENIEEYIEVPEDFKADFVLRVQGDSMVGVGILDGDLAVCKESQVAQSGQIVVALHDLATGFSEATLKYYFNGNGSKPVLKAANPQYQDIKLTEGYRIAGIMVALIREHSPSYLVYQHYLALKDYEEWTEVIEKAAAAGIRPEHLITYIDMMVEMGRRNLGKQ